MSLDYLYIRAWCRMMQSYSTKDQVKQARKDKAPQDAIFWGETEQKWHRWSEMSDDNPNKAIVAHYVEAMR